MSTIDPFAGLAWHEDMLEFLTEFDSIRSSRREHELQVSAERARLEAEVGFPLEIAEITMHDRCGATVIRVAWKKARSSERLPTADGV